MTPPGHVPVGTVRRRTIDDRSTWVPVIVPALLSLGAVAAVAVELGFRTPPLPIPVLRAIQLVLAGAVIALSLRRAAWSVRRAPGVDLACAGVILSGLFFELLGLRRTFLIAELGVVALAIAQVWRINAALSQRLRDPALLFPASFLVLIVAATCLLKLPRATPDDAPISWLDALFTATSAVCVTGLTVRDTLTGFTPLGHAIILIFIQLGGLGVIIFGSTLALLLGGRLSFKQNVSLSTALDEYPTDRIASFVRFIVVTTLALELVGAALMLPMWPDGTPFAQRAWLSLFHAVSAFCNAGFDITGGSMVPHRFSFFTHVVVAGLIVLGGLGYLTMQDLATYARAHLRGWQARRCGRAAGLRPRLAVHTRIVLVTTGSLYLLGLVLILTAQLASDRASHGAAPFWQHLLDAHFSSITTRTAGFASIPTEELAPGTRAVMMLLMLIGGSPGSTAGGLKTVTAAVLVLSVLATLRRRDETEAFGRAIPDMLVKKAATLAVCFLGIVSLCILGLSFTEAKPFELVFFESVSAAATVGLSLGLTPELTPAGRFIVIGTMFLGRVGPLALFAALLSGRRDGQRFSYPHEGVSLG
jgi:trk system potassium uptake protein TrkH